MENCQSVSYKKIAEKSILYWIKVESVAIDFIGDVNSIAEICQLKCIMGYD